MKDETYHWSAFQSASAGWINAGHDLAQFESMRDGDEIDARAMLAVMVAQERERRGAIHARALTPAQRASLYGDSGVREEIEAQNGEPLL